jgi:L-fucose mutarotase/ribose pyranase (RbsD/FucU family)
MTCEIVPLYGKPDEAYSNGDMRAKLGLASHRMIADWYVHYPNCIWAVQECKSKYHLDIALRQLRSTITQLLEKQRKVQIAIIVMERLGREKQMYEVDKKRDNVLMLKSGHDYKISGVTVHLFLERELREIKSRGRL